MTTALPHIELDMAQLPSELMLKDTTDPSRPTWLVQLLRVHIAGTCGVCNGMLGSRDYAYYEQGQPHAAHPGCWILTLPTRSVRVNTVKYR